MNVVYPQGTPFLSASTPQTDLVQVGADGSLRSITQVPRASAAPYATALRYADGSLYVAAVNDLEPYSVLYSVSTSGEYRERAKLINYPRGAQPQSLALAQDAASWYGITRTAGAYNSGVLFRVAANGGITLLHTFRGEDDGVYPTSLVLGSDGRLYGRTQLGGQHGFGTFFRMPARGELAVLHAFETPREGEGSKLVEREPGVFYATNLSAPFGAIVKVRSSGAVEDVYAFTQDDNSYNLPDTFIVGQGGHFYGTTPGMFAPLVPPQFGAGDIYRVSPKGEFTRLAKFKTADPVPSYGPSTIMQLQDGTFYVATSTLPFLTDTKSYSDLLALTFDPLSVKRIATFTTGSITQRSLIQLENGAVFGTTTGVNVTSDSGEPSVTGPTVFEVTKAGAIETRYTANLPQAELLQSPKAALSELHEVPEGALVAVLARPHGVSEILALKP